MTWPYVNGVPLSNVLASSTRNWSAAVQIRRLPVDPGSIRSTSRTGCWVGQALFSTAFNGAARDHASSESVRRRIAWRASTRSRSRRWLIGTIPCLAMSIHVATSARVNTTVRAPIGTATSPSGGTIAASASVDQLVEPVRRSLPAGGRRIVDAADLDLRQAQVERRALPDGALAERRQDVGDVVEERPVRPDHQHAVACQPAAVLEQQVGRAVQGDRRLAGPGTALHDQRLVDRRADHDVLLGLDRRHDLAHRAGPGGADLGQHRVGDAARDLAARRVVEVLVEVGDQLALVEREPPAERHPERVDGRRPVERRRDRRPPVDDDRVVVVVFDVTPPDVPLVDAATATRLVDAPEEIAGTGRAERFERLGDRHLDVLLRELVRRGVGVDPFEPVDHPIARGARERQPRTLRGELGEAGAGRHGPNTLTER